MAASLRRALVDAWADLRRGNRARAASLLEAEIIAAVCDINTYTVDEWERVRSQLEEERQRAARDLSGEGWADRNHP